MAEPLRRPPGTFDVLPGESAAWEELLAVFAGVAAAAGYRLVITPTFEDIRVFQRLGESTDVVRKEMYDFVDKGGRHVALRPEVTASVARAFIEHRPPLPWKTWYAGSNFRFERPQAGRFREFHQVGVEAFGSPDPDLDVEVVTVGWDFLQALGVANLELQVNSLGDARCRPAYRELLLAYLRDRRGELCADHRARLEENPLRVLDCKKPECRAVAAGAPRQVDHLCDGCGTHFERVLAGLSKVGVAHRLQPFLVRGLDYYTRTAFEYAGLSLGSAQDALGGGGRYDGLVAAMGGPDTPAVGLAVGVERALMAVEAEGVPKKEGSRPDAFVVDLTGGEAARDLSTTLRREGFRVERAFDSRSAKAQFKSADRSGARVALVVGPEEAAAGTVGVKDLAAGGGQVSVARSALVAHLRALLR